MTVDEALNALSDRFGIVPFYHDLGGAERRISSDTQKALLRANGLDVGTEALIRETLAEVNARDGERTCPAEVIVESQTRCVLDFGADASWQLVDDSTGAALAEGRGPGSIILPPLPSGVYDLIVRVDGKIESVIVLAAPPHLPQVNEIAGTSRLWGLNAALYGLRSGRNTGLGDYEDLAELAGIAARAGAGFLGVNPVHAMGSSDHEAISPYSPSHRGFLNTSHIALDRVPGLDASGTARDVLQKIGPDVSRLRGSALLQYSPHKALHGQALEALYGAFHAEADETSKAAFASWCAAAGPELSAFSAFEAATEEHGPDWREWSPEVQRQERCDPPISGGDRLARAEYHRWMQWVADCQISTAHARARSEGMQLGLYLDLAVGPRRGGAETWCEADAIAEGVSIGAPPDHLSPEGQNWNLAAFASQKLKAGKYAPFRRILASAMRHAGILRIDHVLGLNRSFWVPDDGSPGGYVRQPFESLVAIIKIEAERAGTVIVGEDLGLVPDGFRASMRRNGFYGYSVLQYERDQNGHFRDPADYDPQVLAFFGTHDTPTLRGFVTGRDIDWWRRLGWIDDATAAKSRDRRETDVAALTDLSKINGDTEPKTEQTDGLAKSVHVALARSPAALVAVQLDDVLGQAEAQNLPGTINEHPNWRRKYQTPLETMEASADMQAFAGWMQNGRRATKPTNLKEV